MFQKCVILHLMETYMALATLPNVANASLGFLGSVCLLDRQIQKLISHLEYGTIRLGSLAENGL